MRRCIAYHSATGIRCRRPVPGHETALCTAHRHGFALFLVMCMSRSEIERLAWGTWTRVVRKRLRRGTAA